MTSSAQRSAAGEHAQRADADLGVLVLGINTHRAVDDAYRTFLSLVASQVTNQASHSTEVKGCRFNLTIERKLFKHSITGFEGLCPHLLAREKITLLLSPSDVTHVRLPRRW